MDSNGILSLESEGVVEIRAFLATLHWKILFIIRCSGLRQLDIFWIFIKKGYMNTTYFLSWCNFSIRVALDGEAG